MKAGACAQALEATPFPRISKHDGPPSVVAPNLADYAEECASFDWRDVRAALALPGAKGLNIAQVALDRQVDAGLGPHLAVRFIDRRGERTSFTYEQLWRSVNRCANALLALGLARGERVFSLLGRSPALHIAALGTMKAGRSSARCFRRSDPSPSARVSSSARLRCSSRRMCFTRAESQTCVRNFRGSSTFSSSAPLKANCLRARWTSTKCS
jgi:acetyl-CoA synthetase